MPSPIRTIDIHDWQQFKDLVTSPTYRSWAFRGQSDAAWQLKSSLTRHFEDFHVHRQAWSVQESRALRIFQRKAHLYLEHVPPEHDEFQWLALMQHHGTPTRLIDFTWSPFVAAFFALHKAKKNAAAYAVFPPAIDHSEKQTIRDGTVINARERWLRIPGNFEKFFLPGIEPFAITGEPHVMNQRLIAQSGTFVVPGKLDEPLDDILSDYKNSNRLIAKFIFYTDSVRKRAMKELYDSNITEATLFPGIDGMARSLAFELEYHWAYDPITMERIPGFENPPFELPPAVS